MKKAIRLLALAVVAVGLVACQKEPRPAPPPKISTPASAGSGTTDLMARWT